MEFQSILSAATGGHGLAVNPSRAVAYLVAGVLFILALEDLRNAIATCLSIKLKACAR